MRSTTTLRDPGHPHDEHDGNRGALGTYLNDHLAGATLGLDHARQLAENYGDDAFGAEMRQIAVAIEEDRETLIEVMDALGTPRNVVKSATAWVAEKAGRLKFGGVTSGDRELGSFLALETMSLGVEGKRSLWMVLRAIAPRYRELDRFDFARLLARAEAQRGALEAEKLRAAMRTFAVPAGVTP